MIRRHLALLGAMVSHVFAREPKHGPSVPDHMIRPGEDYLHPRPRKSRSGARHRSSNWWLHRKSRWRMARASRRRNRI